MSIAYYRPGAGECAAAIALKSGVDHLYCLRYNTGFPNYLMLPETVYLLGVAVSTSELEQLCKECNVVFIDHRDDNIAKMKKSIEVKNLSSKVKMIVDETTSMSVQTWRYFSPDQPPPDPVVWYGKYKMWELDDEVLAFNAGSKLYKSSSVETWTKMLNNDNDIVASTMQRGIIIRDYYREKERYQAHRLVYETILDGIRVYAANTKTSSSLMFNEIYSSKTERPDFGVCYGWEPKRKAYSITIYKLNDKAKTSAADISRKHGGSGGNSAAATFHITELPFEQKEGNLELNGACLDDFDWKQKVKDTHPDDKTIIDMAIDNDRRMNSWKQQLVEGDDFVGVANNLPDLNWTVDTRNMSTAKYQISWCWVAHSFKGNGYHVIMLPIDGGKDGLIHHVSKTLPFNLT